MQADVPPGCEPPTDRVAEQARTARVRFEPRLMDAPFLDVLENVFDKAHLPFIHAGSFGRDQDPLVARQRVTVDADERGLSAEDEPGAPWRAESKLPRGAVGLVARLLLGLRAPVAQRTRFDVAEGVQLSIEYPAGTYDRFVTRITPADDGHTWLFVESIRTRAPHALGDWVQRRAIGRLFAEGERETALLLRPDSGEPLTPVSVESDRVGLAARRLYERWAGDAARAGGDRPRRTAS
jgi:hypothetical protein